MSIAKASPTEREPDLAEPRPPVAAATRTRTAAVALGGLTAALVLVARSAGLLAGPVGLALLAVLALAVPTARTLSRRVLLTGALASGLAPLLYLVPVPAPGPAALLMAALAGGLVGGAVWHGPRLTGERLRRFVPHVRGVEAIVLAAGAGAAWVVLPWWRAGDGAGALAALLPGWDHSAHYDMTAMIRAHHVTTDRLAASGGDWKFADYPQGHHSFSALIMDAVAPVPGSPGQEVLLYVQAQALVLVLSGVLLAAAMVTVGWLRHRPLIALPAVAGAVAALVAGPGGHAFVAGFVNFVPSVALATAVVFVARELGRGLTPLPLLATCALLVAVAHDWVLLLAVALPAAALAVPQLVREWPRATTGRRVTALLIAAGGALGALHVAAVLRTVSAGATLVTPGGFPATDAGALVATCLFAVGAALALGGRGARLAVVPAAGLAAAAALGGYQVLSTGSVSYYFWKLLLGVSLASCAVLAVALAGFVVRLRRPRPAVGMAVAAAVTLAATQAYGVVGTHALFGVPTAEVADASDLLAAADVARTEPAVHWTVLLDPGTTTVNPANAQQWLLALTGSWTTSANEAAVDLVTITDRTALVRERLTSDPAARVLVAPSELGAMRAALGDAALADRVTGWQSP